LSGGDDYLTTAFVSCFTHGFGIGGKSCGEATSTVLTGSLEENE